MVSNPDWTRDELILACDLMMDGGWRQIRATDSRAVELSALLKRASIHPPDRRTDKFRSIGSVSRKTADIATVHPAYRGGKTRGSKLDREVLDDFLISPDEMRSAAAEIRKGIVSGEFAAGSTEDVTWDVAFPEDVGFREGKLLAGRYFRRERDRRLRAQKIAEFLETADRVRCEVCYFDFEAVYGPHGSDYIECHHVVPLHVSGETKTKLADLILLCANCHRMIHYRPQWLHPEDLRALVTENSRKC
ncbi:HNH endonuclease [Nocardia sp. NBC_00508]|uniref:HNH endonuclease n=1 Tax=Nocardia sp. NBC_00508 TaxID=2975992 RepID=UPI002E8111CA|nr:HNH endonuclease [Nocardia sp. NBC_00508]WUD64863.1 HNH endonuclease [Nocardia sp. NBC_00508]